MEERWRGWRRGGKGEEVKRGKVVEEERVEEETVVEEAVRADGRDVKKQRVSLL